MELYDITFSNKYWEYLGVIFFSYLSTNMLKVAIKNYSYIGITAYLIIGTFILFVFLAGSGDEATVFPMTAAVLVSTLIALFNYLVSNKSIDNSSDPD